MHWCSCGNCEIVSSPRENFCCHEVLQVTSSPFSKAIQRVKEKLEDVSGKCIVEHPSFQNLVLNKEVYCLWMEMEDKWTGDEQFGAGKKNMTSFDGKRHVASVYSPCRDDRRIARAVA
ncbi:hypothetical protein Y032_0011g1364 [Ancylostoma ceylanicum]|uniref:Uncharacterized protein n=1 Tax=Ancylostoma ceylanicum TaxID=53326 RepID=A0A016VG67_9BILA|nr:hypothetical protein Y032_0011g1364 [Ancylostoma ceylanicum]